jgi:hypothetical protein
MKYKSLSDKFQGLFESLQQPSLPFWFIRTLSDSTGMKYTMIAILRRKMLEDADW